MASTPPPPTVEPSRKRIRNDGDNEGSVMPNIVKSAQLWLPDGNIVLHTGVCNTATQQCLAFKVHKSVLALHATFFRDLFDGPQAAFVAGSESFEGLPLMEMPDSPEDTESFLKALYFPEYTRRHCVSSRLKSLPEGYAGILRLATKYEAEGLREVVVAAFKQVWPSKLSEWLELQKGINDEAINLNEVEGTMLNISHMYDDPAKAIRLATDCDVPVVLPVAYYDLARVYAFNRRSALYRYRHPDMSVLTAAELLKLVSGLGEIRNSMAHFSKPPIADATSTSTDLFACGSSYTRPGLCQKTARGLWQEQINSMDPSSGDVVTWLHTMADQFATSEDICSSCASTSIWKQRRLTSRDEIWRNLPTYFGLKTLVTDEWGTI